MTGMDTLEQVKTLSERLSLKVELVERAAMFDSLVKDGMRLIDVAEAVGLGSHEAVRAQIAKYGPGTEPADAVARWHRRQHRAAKRAAAAAK
jgi:hypothetical protein